MDLPAWVRQEIEKYAPPDFGEVTIMVTFYRGGIRFLDIGSSIRVQPPASVRCNPPTGHFAVDTAPPNSMKGRRNGRTSLENLPGS